MCKNNNFFKINLFLYKNKKDGVAIKISTFTKYKNALDPYLLNKDFIPPQSYLYYDGDFGNN